MPIIKIPIWIKSEYVTMDLPSFLEGQKALRVEELTAYRYGSPSTFYHNVETNKILKIKTLRRKNGVRI